MKLLIITMLSVFLYVLPLHAEDKAQKDYVVLKVGDEEIKKSEVEDVWKSVFPGGNPPPFDSFDQKVKDNLLRGVASEHILLKEAKKSDVQDSDEVKTKIAAAERQIIIQEFLKQKTKDMVSDEKLKEAYDEHIKSINADGGEEIHARHILVKTEAEAKDISKKLKKGASFEKLAKEKSQDKSAEAGGDLGWFTADRMVPEFSKAAFALKKGEVSGPVKTDFGWHVIQVLDRRKATPPSFDEMKDALRAELGNKGVSDYVNGLMKDVKITEYDAAGHETDLPAIPPAPKAAEPAKKSEGDKKPQAEEKSDKQ